MKGKNSITMNQETIKEALEQYMNGPSFFGLTSSSHEKVRITSNIIAKGNENQKFEFTFESQIRETEEKEDG